MLAANLPYLFNILIFIGYFVFYRDGKTWPDQFLWWAWLPYIAHVWFHHFADGLQNTTRNIARIYLIKNHGVDYDRRLVAPIQTALIPDSMLPIVILWVAVHIGSFTTLLFFQGWAMALVAEFVLIIFGGFFPINYQAHLKRVYKYVQNLGPKKSLAFQMAGVSTEELTELLGQAISERRNPQLWWGIVLRDATQEIVEGEVTNSSDGRRKIVITEKSLHKIMMSKVPESSIILFLIGPHGEKTAMLTIGKDIEQATVDEFRDPDTGAIYGGYIFEKGQENTFLLQKSLYNKMKTQMNSMKGFINSEVDRALGRSFDSTGSAHD